TEDYITDEGLARGSRLVPAGTVLLLTRGMTLMNDVPLCVAQRPLAFNQDIQAIRAGTGLAAAYLAYLLLSTKRRLPSMGDFAGHGTGRLNTDELRSLPILLPPIYEQQHIAHILGTLDDKIELNRRMSETLEATARALFESWFVRFAPVRAEMEGR